MLTLGLTGRIWLCTAGVDGRKSYDGLAAVVTTYLAGDPLNGDLYVFKNRRGTALKMLCYDSRGFWLITRRFSKGRLRWWPTDEQSSVHPLEAHQLSVLLYNGLPDQAHFAPSWRPLPADSPVAPQVSQRLT